MPALPLGHRRGDRAPVRQHRDDDADAGEVGGRARGATAELRHEARRRARGRGRGRRPMPAWARLRAIGQPMLPRPTKPTSVLSPDPPWCASSTICTFHPPMQSRIVYYNICDTVGALMSPNEGRGRVRATSTSSSAARRRRSRGRRTAAGTSSTSATSSRVDGLRRRTPLRPRRASAATPRRRCTRTSHCMRSTATPARRWRASTTRPRPAPCRVPDWFERGPLGVVLRQPARGPDRPRPPRPHLRRSSARRRRDARSRTTSSGTRRTRARTCTADGFDAMWRYRLEADTGRPARPCEAVHAALYEVHGELPELRAALKAAADAGRVGFPDWFDEILFASLDCHAASRALAGVAASSLTMARQPADRLQPPPRGGHRRGVLRVVRRASAGDPLDPRLRLGAALPARAGRARLRRADELPLPRALRDRGRHARRCSRRWRSGGSEPSTPTPSASRSTRAGRRCRSGGAARASPRGTASRSASA